MTLADDGGEEEDKQSVSSDEKADKAQERQKRVSFNELKDVEDGGNQLRSSSVLADHHEEEKQIDDSSSIPSQERPNLVSFNDIIEDGGEEEVEEEEIDQFRSSMSSGDAYIPRREDEDDEEEEIDQFRSSMSSGDTYIPRREDEDDEEEERDQVRSSMSSGGTYIPHRRQGIKASTVPSILYDEENDSYNEFSSRGSRPSPRSSFGRSSSIDGKVSGSNQLSKVQRRNSPVVHSASLANEAPSPASESMFQRMLRSVWTINRRQDPKSVVDGTRLDQDTALGVAFGGAFGGASNQLDSIVAAAAAVVSGGVTATDFRAQRRYNVGDFALVVGHVAPKQHMGDEDAYGAQYIHPIQKQKLIYNPVNKYGFPPGKGTTEEELRPPYVYVLARVTKVHFEEDARYYTVIREDNQLEQRADTEFMEPILNEKAKLAALEAAQTKLSPLLHHSYTGSNDLDKSLAQRSEESKIWKYCCLCAHALDFLWLILKSIASCCVNQIVPPLSCASTWSYRCAKSQARLLLSGLKPYEVNLRVTYVNVMVLCSLIFIFSDTFMLAFLPPRLDLTTSWISLVAWFLLVLELLFEVFIRPSGYSALIHSEKAYAPSTARYINRFHLAMELIALLFYIPEILCIFKGGNSCSYASTLNLMNATFLVSLAQSNTILSLNSYPRKAVFVGNCILATLRLRVFGIVRFWKRMWINRSFIQSSSGFFHRFIPPKAEDNEGIEKNSLSTDSANKRFKKNEEDDDADDDNFFDLEIDKVKANTPKPPSKEEDLRLKNASTIGTALMVINSHRTILVVVAIVIILPIISSIRVNGGANVTASSLTDMLQGNNLVASSASSYYGCEYLGNATVAWLQSMALDGTDTLYLLWAQILPVRCNFQGEDGVVTAEICRNKASFESSSDAMHNLCSVWVSGSSPTSFASKLDIRPGEILSVNLSDAFLGTSFVVNTMFNEASTVQRKALGEFLLQLALLCIVLIWLSVLRFDGQQLVLNPLRRMLKIVLRYAENPLVSTPQRTKIKQSEDSDESMDGFRHEESENEECESEHDEDELGNYETEKLISAITKITDLLRKCWGVAGADIISSNLARTEGGKTAVFNPCVPGRLVYALFGFVGICDFSQHLRALDKDVMILINDVARVVHGEIYRWGFGDTGQCNKNLGAVFLMVFRIGDAKEVEKKKMQATEVIFSSKSKENYTKIRRRMKSSKVSVQNPAASKARLRRKKIAQRRRKMSEVMSDSLQLASLPGISAFADRALIGFLKSYATIHRDKKMQSWKNDFRLGAGVGAFSVDMMFGMDAGWAVEGAVGSEYKIDATYLSPHVNMASRMMSATKQYGLKLLVSQAVEELLTDTARDKLRHVDTVTVKGSSVRQKVFTYDMRYQGVDFFLFARSDKDADLDAECYAESIWTSDQDLLHMRNHVSCDFLEQFNFGRDQYISGNWPSAIEHLIKADQIMIKHVLDEGFVEESTDTFDDQIPMILDWDNNEDTDILRIRNELGDGPAQSLIAFMSKRGGVAPANWEGYRPLTSK